MSDLTAEDNARAWRRASRRWLGKPKNCSWLQRWWHRRLRRQDRVMVFPDGSVGVWRDDFNGNGPNYYNQTNFPHWWCACADEDAAIRKDV